MSAPALAAQKLVSLAGQQRARPTDQQIGLVAAFVLLVGLLCTQYISLVQCQEQLSSNLVDAHGPQKMSSSSEDLSDTLKYLEKLEKLDKYWSEVARPRFGRSEYKQQGSTGARSMPVIVRHQLPNGATLNASPLADLLAQSILARRLGRFGSNEAY